MKVKKINNIFLIAIIYMAPISLLFAPFSNELYVRLSITLFLILLTTYINRGKISLRFVLVYCFITILLCVNLLTVDYKNYVFADAINILVMIYIPLFLITSDLICYKILFSIWNKFAMVMTFFLPLYYYYFQEKIINYMDFGYLAHLNLIIFSYSFFKNRKKNKLVFLCFFINLVVSIVFGSRMLMIASLVVIVFSAIWFSKKNLGYVFYILTGGLISYLILYNLSSILSYAILKLEKYNLNSRNLNLFYNQVSEQGTEIYLSGREEIYEIVKNYLSENGLFPSGISVARYLTDGRYYHAHSFILEFNVVFGYLFSLILFGLFFMKIIYLLKNRKKINDYKVDLLLLFLVSFITGSITGTYFVTNPLFIVCFSIIIAEDFQRKTKTNFN